MLPAGLPDDHTPQNWRIPESGSRTAPNRSADPFRAALGAYFDFYNHGWVGEGTSCLNGYFFPKPPVKPDVIVSHHPAFSVLPR